ncbi:WW domain-containing protein wwm1 [Saitoella coloradoensis]
MSPPGPPPNDLPEGWVAQWDDRYNAWFYVDTRTGQSTWEKPQRFAPPAGPPPGAAGGLPDYSGGGQGYAGEKSHSPYPDQQQQRYDGGYQQSPQHYVGGSGPAFGGGTYAGPVNPQPQKKSGLGGLLSKFSGKSSSSSGGMFGGGGGYPQQHYGQPQYVQQGYGRKTGGMGGMGMGGGLALGALGGLAAGAMMNEAFDDDNGDYGGGDGGDFGGGDDMGGDF